MVTLPYTVGSFDRQEPVNTTAGYNATAVPQALEAAGGVVQQAGLEKQRIDYLNEATTAQQRLNAAKSQMATYFYGDGTPENPGVLSKRGADLNGVVEKYQDYASTMKDTVLQGINNPMLQKQMGSEVDSLTTDHQGRLEEFVQGQQRDMRGNTLEATKSLSNDDISRNYLSDQSFSDNMAQIDGASRAQAAMNGVLPGDPRFTQIMQNGRDGAFSSRFNPMLNSGDPAQIAKAVTEYDHYRPMMSADLVAKMDGPIKAALPIATAVQTIQNTNMKLANPDNLPPDVISQAQAMRESGGKQWGGPGTVKGSSDPTTSNEGAVGVMQIEPGTGPDAAKMAGLPWRPDLFNQGQTGNAQKDAEATQYNMALGHAYREGLAKQYGSQTMALLAYNAGPGNVQDVMNGTNDHGHNPGLVKLGDPSKGGISPQDFVKNFPNSDARQYVNDVINLTGVKNKIVPDSVINQTVASSPLLAQEHIRQMFDAQNNAARAAQMQQQQQVVGQAVQTAVKTGNKMLTPELQSQMQNMGYLDKFKTWNPTQSDQQTLAGIYSMDAPQMAKLNLDNPSLMLSLSVSDRNALKQQQQNMGDPATLASVQQQKQMVTDTLNRLGRVNKNAIDSTNVDENGLPTMKADYAQSIVATNDIVNQEKALFARDNNGRQPTAPEMQKIVDRAAMQTNVVTPGTLYGTNTSKVYPSDLRVAAPTSEESSKGVTQIPEGATQRIRAAMIRNGITPTDNAIIAYYITGVQSGK